MLIKHDMNTYILRWRCEHDATLSSDGQRVIRPVELLLNGNGNSCLSKNTWCFCQSLQTGD